MGSEHRSDDGAGPAVVAELLRRGTLATDVGPVVDPLDLLGRWDRADLAVIVDAVRTGASPGTISVVEVGPSDGTAGGSHGAGGQSGASTHGIGVVGALRLARAIDAAPHRVVLVGIEGADFGRGIGLSPAVGEAVGRAATAVSTLIAGAATCA